MGAVLGEKFDKLMLDIFGVAGVSFQVDDEKADVGNSDGHLEKTVEEKSASVSSYRHCSFDEFVKMISAHFPIREEFCKNPSWFTVREAVEVVQNFFLNVRYEISENEAEKFLDSLVLQGIYEKHEGKYHKLMFCYFTAKGTYFFKKSGDERKLAKFNEI